MDIQSLTSTGSRRQDFNLSLLRHGGGAWWLVLGMMAMQEGSILANRYMITPLAKGALNSNVGTATTSAIAHGFRNYTWLVGPALIAGLHVLRRRTHGVSATESKFLKSGGCDLKMKDRLLSNKDAGSCCDTAYNLATASLNRLNHGEANISEHSSHRLAIHSTTRIALQTAFHDNPAIAKLLLRHDIDGSSRKPTKVMASDLLILANLVKDGSFCSGAVC